MSCLRFFVTLVTAACAVASVHAGPNLLKKKVDPERVSPLVETLKGDPDEKKRKSAADELGGADSRINPEVATALVNALQKDLSASVRAEAAASLGDLPQVFPVAGQALEMAAANDSSPMVRFAAKRTLWEYHLSGYRSPKGADGTSTQTIEPPIASPSAPRPVVAIIPAPPPPMAALRMLPPFRPQLPPASAPAVSHFEPILPLVGPRIWRSWITEMFPNQRFVNRTPIISAAPPAVFNLTQEPPLAKRPGITLPPFPEPTFIQLAPPPTITFIPPPPLEPLKPDFPSTLSPFEPHLPSAVLSPSAEPPLVEPMKIPATLPPK